MGGREIVARFDEGRVTSDGGGMLLREVDRRFGILDRLAGCFRNYRDPGLVDHSLVDLPRQRVFGLCLSYEDLSDHDSLRHDPMLAVMVGKADPLGVDRPGRDRGKALAGKSTLHRLELTRVRASEADRYKKIDADLPALQDFLVDVYLDQQTSAPQEIVLDVDATDDPVHGDQLAARVFTDLEYRTQKSWSRSRRVVAKAEHLTKGANPRFVVTSLAADECDARTLYETRYCARGEMENRIKEQQLCLFADRTSCKTMRANQLRLLLSTVAYVILRALREHGLRDTPMARARADTIRLKLLKIGAVVRVSVRKVLVSLSQSYPWQATFAKVWQNLTAWRQPAPSSA